MTNAQSLGNKKDDVDVILRQENIDIAVVTEYWLSPNNIDYLNIHGYCIYSKAEKSIHEEVLQFLLEMGSPPSIWTYRFQMNSNAFGLKLDHIYYQEGFLQ